MDYNKLHYFYMVAKHKNMTYAAQQLHISQPALSKAIRLLEEDLQVPLFHKQRRKLELTPCGQLLKARLDHLFPPLESLPQELKLLNNTTNTTIILNVMIASIVTTDAIAKYKALHPHVNFLLSHHTDSPDSDISITAYGEDRTKHNAFMQQHIIEEPVFLAVPKNSPYSDQNSVDLMQMKDAWFIFPSHARSFRYICDEFCHRAGFKPNVTFESDFPSAVQNLICAGAGIGFWPAYSFGPISDDAKLLTIRSPQCARKLFLGLHKKAHISEVTKDFYRFLIDYIETQKASQ